MLKSFRGALMKVLEESLQANANMVVLCADSARALNLAGFSEKYPGKMYCLGISEADMLSAAAGMATTGLLPVVVGFSMFVTDRPYEQIRQSIAYPHLNVKIIATHAGLCVGKDGATHQNVEDMAVMRVLPGMRVLAAADVAQTSAAVAAMLADDSPAYLRLGRDLAEDIYTQPTSVRIGGSDLLREGGDVTIAACGLMVHPALQAAELLTQRGVQASVLNAYSVKPLDEDAIAGLARRTGALVSVEDHSIIGGLGGAIAECLARRAPVPMEFVGVPDTFGESGTQDDLYVKYGLIAERIAEAALRAVSRKEAR